MKINIHKDNQLSSPTYKQAIIAADILYEGYLFNKSKGASDYFLERTICIFWAYVIRDVVPEFLKLWKSLYLNHYTSQKSAYLDSYQEYSIWVDSLVDGRQILFVIDPASSSSNDPHFIFIFKQVQTYVSFKCVTARDQEQVWENYPLNDHNRIKHPSIDTHINYDFELGYSDGRDDWHVFMYNSHPEWPVPVAVDSHISELKIQNAINIIHMINTHFHTDISKK